MGPAGIGPATTACLAQDASLGKTIKPTLPLSYGPIRLATPPAKSFGLFYNVRTLAGGGFEPPTSGLWAQRANQAALPRSEEIPNLEIRNPKQIPNPNFQSAPLSAFAACASVVQIDYGSSGSY